SSSSATRRARSLARLERPADNRKVASPNLAGPTFGANCPHGMNKCQLSAACWLGGFKWTISRPQRGQTGSPPSSSPPHAEHVSPQPRRGVGVGPVTVQQGRGLKVRTERWQSESPARRKRRPRRCRLLCRQSRATERRKGSWSYSPKANRAWRIQDTGQLRGEGARLASESPRNLKRKGAA